MESNSITNYIKQKYPEIVLSKQDIHDGLKGFILSEDKATIGVMNSVGKMFILGNTRNVEFLLKRNINDIFKRVPEIIVTKDKVGDISRVFRNTEQIDSRINGKIIEFLNSRMESKVADVNYKVLYDTQSKEFLNVKQNYIDKIDEITKKYNISLEKLEQCKNIIMNQKEEVIKSINNYKEGMKKYVRSKNMKISELKELYEKSKDERKQIQDKLDDLLVLYQKENGKKMESEKILKESEMEISKLKKSNVQLAEREEEIKNLKMRIEEYIKGIKEKQDEIDALKVDKGSYKQKEEELKVIKEDLDRMKESVGKNESDIALLRVSMEGVVGGEEKIKEKEVELGGLRGKLDEKSKMYEEKKLELEELRRVYGDKSEMIRKCEMEMERMKGAAEESNNVLKGLLEENKVEIADLKGQIEINLQKIKEKEEEIELLKRGGVGVVSPRDFEERIKDKEREIEELKRMFSQGDTMLKEKESEIIKLKDKLEQNKEEIASQKREMDILVGSSKKSSDEIKSVIEEKEGEINKLRGRLDELRGGKEESKKASTLEAEVKERDIEMGVLKRTLEMTKADLDGMIKEKDVEISVKTREKAELEDRIKEIQSEARELKKQLERYGSDIKKVEETISGKVSEVGELNNKLKEAKRKLADKIVEKEREIEELRGRLSMSSGDWERKLEEKEMELKNVREEMKKVTSGLERTIEEKEREINMFKEKLSISSKELERMIEEKERELKGMNKELRGSSRDLESGIEKKEDEIDKLTKRLEKVTKEYEEKLESKQGQLDKLQEKMDRRVEEMQKSIEEKEKELEGLRGVLKGDDAKGMIIEKEGEIRRLNGELKSSIERMQGVINEKEKEIAKLSQGMVSKAEGVEQVILEKEKEKESLDKSLEESTKDLKGVIEEKEKEINTLNEKLNMLKVDLEGKIKERDEEISNLNKKLLDREGEMRGIIEEKDREIKVLKDAAMKSGDSAKMLEEKMKELSALQLKIKSSTDELNRRIVEREGEIEELKKKVMVSDKGVDQKELEIKRLTELIKTTNIKKDEEIGKLRRNMDDIQKELDGLKEELSKTKLQNVLLEGYRVRCKEKFIRDKDTIINAIKDYKNRWILWSKKFGVLDSGNEKAKLFEELNKIKDTLQVVMKDKDLLSDDYNTFKQSANEIKLQLERTIGDQIVELNKRDERIKELSIKSEDVGLEEKNRVIERLQVELADVRKLLAQNDATKIQVNVNCDNALKNFCSLNNIFYRKVEIIKKLDEIINKNMGIFTNLDDVIKADIKKRFEDIKGSIMKHIDFLNLKRYINDQTCRQYLDYLKSESTRNKVPVEFCNQMVDLLDYWNLNKLEYREQDRLLTNIYEDLSGAVRVYVRIKLLTGEKTNVVSVKSFEGKKTKSLTINCGSTTNDLGEFYGVFDDTFDNIDLYTGVKGTIVEGRYNVSLDSIVENTESINPGLYSVFKQAEDGYSIVLFGYGLSGSGKTYSLLGSQSTPGLIHYGFSNLQGVKNIKLKYLFEQYYGLVNANFGKLTGRIHNLIREVPQLGSVSKNETEQFRAKIPGDINVDDLRVDQFNRLTDVITVYRKERNRIKKTPNNDESSRSHLFMVFEVSFTSGKKGYISVIDMAGRESPMDIFDMFIDSSRTKLASVMSPSGEVSLIRKTLKPGLSYTPENVFDILKEGFYINETINHLIYYFNKKNFRYTKPSLQVSDVGKYDVTRYYVKPQDEEEVIKFNVGNNCLMIPILKFLEGLSNKGSSSWLPTKFITIVNVRQEERYCTQTLETLQFAQSIKSS